ncbi:SHOCT domain-containing protein [Streptomyces naganishii]|uniref:Membrane protein n=1 Tax=Streptomyces naganishii JCM 4654 TaxID=1306179 RepID=A0A919CZS1_9ACTN|nr:SHOCT domain-containing protein [Streptomyces naganishii]GHD97202.1 membrane protein [Streptomyces naganishii JCM 4654]
MMYYPHGMNGWGWFAMSLGTVLFWALLIAAGVLLFRALDRGPGRTPRTAAPGRPAPEQLLAERFARGEIDEDEYRRRLEVLRRDGAEHTGPMRTP